MYKELLAVVEPAKNARVALTDTTAVIPILSNEITRVPILLRVFLLELFFLF